MSKRALVRLSFEQRQRVEDVMEWLSDFPDEAAEELIFYRGKHDELVACLRELMECAGTPFSELRRRKFEAAKARAEKLLEGK